MSNVRAQTKIQPWFQCHLKVCQIRKFNNQMHGRSHKRLSKRWHHQLHLHQHFRECHMLKVLQIQCNSIIHGHHLMVYPCLFCRYNIFIHRVMKICTLHFMLRVQGIDFLHHYRHHRHHHQHHHKRFIDLKIFLLQLLLLMKSQGLFVCHLGLFELLIVLTRLYHIQSDSILIDPIRQILLLLLAEIYLVRYFQILIIHYKSRLFQLK